MRASTAREREAGSAVWKWFKGEDFDPVLAVEVNTWVDLNREIIEEIKSSDYFVFINFLSKKRCWYGVSVKESSIYANQELAVAIALGFEHRMLLFQQKNAPKEGSFGVAACNSEFNTVRELVEAIESCVSSQGWNNASYRHLRVEKAEIDEPRWYTDRDTRLLRIAHINVRNSRPDVAALECAIRLVTVESPSLGERPSLDKTRLKVTGHGSAYSVSIWPESFNTFDLFGIDVQSYPNTYLLSESDVGPRQPIISTREQHTLTYEIFAQGFPKVPRALSQFR